MILHLLAKITLLSPVQEVYSRFIKTGALLGRVRSSRPFLTEEILIFLSRFIFAFEAEALRSHIHPMSSLSVILLSPEA